MNIETSYLKASQEYQKGNYASALYAINQALDSRQDSKIYALLARTLLKLDMKPEAATAYALAGRESGGNAERFIHKAMMLHFECGNDDDALLNAKKLMKPTQMDADVAYVLASIFLKRGQKEILGPLRQPLLESTRPEHLALSLRLLEDSPADETNFKTLARTMKLFPANHGVRILHLIHCQEFCEFDGLRKHQPILDAAIAAGNASIVANSSPFYSLMGCGDERLNMMAAMGTHPYPAGTPERRRARPHNWSSDRIRIGYLSYDFWDAHATMKLLGNVLERHDRDRFEITLFCHTPEEHLARNRIDRSLWGNIVRIDQMSDQEAATEIQSRNIDILVDLKGSTTGNRSRIMNLETAPVHVSWLGFPGTSINLDIDYIIGDRFVLPEDSKPFFYEKFCRMPESYQPNDPVHRPLPQPASREEHDLPDDAFIFASFNANRKITPDFIEMWGRILKRCRNSVLWIMVESERARNNILRELESRGIPRKQIVFSLKVPYQQHMERLPLADLGLDTFPVTGHTTTSEQLWAGLPVLTRKGTNFASRVSESLLNAIDLPELVVEDNEAYVEKAVWFYENREQLAVLRQRLVDNRFRAPLFDAERFCRHLESAYETMAAKARTGGQQPDHFDVEPLPARTAPFHPQ